MTLEELKSEADRQGYVLVKKKAYQERYLPCVCGCTTSDARFRRGLGDDGYYFRTCPKCGFTVKVHQDELGWRGGWESRIKIVWNEAVSKNTG